MTEMSLSTNYNEFTLIEYCIAFPAFLQRFSACGVLESPFQCEERLNPRLHDCTQVFIQVDALVLFLTKM